MAFYETRLPDHIERDARGGAGFDTTILRMQSGREKRNINWPEELGAWDVRYGARTLDDIREILSCHRVMHGRGHGFRFRDWLDYKLVRQNIGATDGADATWQLFQRHTFGSGTYDYTIRKPVSGTVKLWVDNVERSLGGGGTQFQVDTSTGVITLGATLAAMTGKAIEAACLFDKPVRFDIDKMDWALTMLERASDSEADDGIAGIPAIPIVELAL